MSRIRTPDERRCERCGRTDVWDEGRGAWRIVTEGDERKTGTPYCLHEWDINGSFSPIERNT